MTTTTPVKLLRVNPAIIPGNDADDEIISHLGSRLSKKGAHKLRKEYDAEMGEEVSDERAERAI